MSELRFMRIRVLQRIENRHKNYSSMLLLSSQMRIWVYENQDTESTRNFTVDSQRHWVYENLYHQFSETLSLQKFKSHTNLNVSSMIRIQVTYDLQEISQRSNRDWECWYLEVYLFSSMLNSRNSDQLYQKHSVLEAVISFNSSDQLYWRSEWVNLLSAIEFFAQINLDALIISHTLKSIIVALNLLSSML